MRAGAVTGFVFAGTAALAFGLMNVVAKQSGLHPLVLAAGAYLVAGVALVPWLWTLRLRRGDLGAVALMVASGGIAAPVLVFSGLRRTTAANASFILTLEVVFTGLLAWWFLSERLGPRARVGLALLLAAGLSVAAGSARGEAAGGSSLVGDLLVMASAFAWGVDNTVSTALTARYRPHQLVALKALAGGAIVGLLVAGLGLEVPLDTPAVASILFMGLFGIGLMTLLFYAALQRIGATRTVAVFIPLGSLTGAVAANLVLDEALSRFHAAGAALLLVGMWVFVRSSLAHRPPIQPVP